MKKLFFIVPAFCFAFSFTSCSSTDDIQSDMTGNEIEMETNEQMDFVDLQKEISDLQNDLSNSQTELNSQTDKSNKTRGFLSKLLNYGVKIFFSDCAGAVKGLFKGDNVINSAISASQKTAVKLLPDVCKDVVNTLNHATRADIPAMSLLNSKSEALNDIVLIANDSLVSASDSIGFYHNAAIYDAFEKENSINYWVNSTDEECIQTLNTSVNNVFPSSYNSVSQEVLDKEFYMFIGDASVESKNYKEMAQMTIKKYPEMRDLFNTVSIFFEGVELLNTEEEWRNYCISVLRLIEKSNISNEDKNALKTGVQVGYASSKLWNVE